MTPKTSSRSSLLFIITIQRLRFENLPNSVVKVIGIFAVIAMLVTGTGDAQANTIVQYLYGIDNIPLSYPPPEILAFAPFDPTLGTLTAVNFNLESQITDYLTATSSDPLGAVATDQTTVQIGLSAFDTETKILTNGCSTFGSTSCSSVAQTYWEFIVTLTGSSIYNFTSTGYSYFTISPSVTHSCTVSDPFDSCTIDEFTQFDYSTPTLQYPSGFMKVTYDYTPFIAQQIPVPEPSSASVLGSGLFGLFLLAGWETRRRRKAARGSFGET